MCWCKSRPEALRAGISPGCGVFPENHRASMTTRGRCQMSCHIHRAKEGVVGSSHSANGEHHGTLPSTVRSRNLPEVRQSDSSKTLLFSSNDCPLHPWRQLLLRQPRQVIQPASLGPLVGLETHRAELP